MNEPTVQNFFAVTVQTHFSEEVVAIYGGQGNSSSTLISNGFTATETNDTFIQIQARFQKKQNKKQI